MKVLKRKDVLRMQSKFRMMPLCSKLTFLKVVFQDLKSMICHLNKGITWLFEGILFICGPSAKREGREWHYKGANKQYSLKKSCHYHYLSLSLWVLIIQANLSPMCLYDVFWCENHFAVKLEEPTSVVWNHRHLSGNQQIQLTPPSFSECLTSTRLF